MERLPDLIASLYADGVNQSMWHVFTDQASAYFNADGCVLSFKDIQNPSNPLVFKVGAWSDSGERESVLHEEPIANLVQGTPVGQVFTNGDIVAPTEINSASVSEVKKLLAGTVYRDERYEAVIGFLRSPEKPDFGDVEKQLLKQFFPFLTHAVGSKLESEFQSGVIEAELILDQVPTACAIVTKKGKMVLGNELFENVKQQKSLFYLYAKQLHFFDSRVQAWFTDFAQEKISARARKDKSQNRSILRIEDDSYTMLLKLSHLKKAIHFSSDEIESGELVLSIYSPRFQGRSAVYRQLFDFTKAEAEVAELLSFGLTMTDLAERKNVSKHTLRTQLKSIFQKTNTHSQNELVILLSNVV